MTAKGQITVPVRICRKLGLKAGHQLEFDETAPYLKAVKAFSKSEMLSMVGCLKHKLKGPLEKHLKLTRGAVKLPARDDNRRR